MVMCEWLCRAGCGRDGAMLKSPAGDAEIAGEKPLPLAVDIRRSGLFFTCG